ncbi:MAG: DUF2062 domain-containing protein [Halobacteriota archaeon]
MVVERLRAYRIRVRSALEAAFDELHTPHQIGASFGIGIFITALPTLGTGLVLFVVLAYLCKWVNKIALFSSVVVLNPIVKPLVYLASYRLGAVIFDPAPVVLFDVVVLDTAVNVTRQLLVGNLIIAGILSVLGYLLVRRLTIEYRTRNLHLLDSGIDTDGGYNQRRR